MSPFGFRSFNRNWVNSRYSFATKTLIGCERGHVTNDMVSCTKLGKWLHVVQNPYLPYFEEQKKLKMPTYPILKSIKS